MAEEWNVPAAGSPALAASYVYGNYIDEVLTMRRAGADYYYHADDQHNVVKLTESAGAVVEAYDYADYGLPEFFDATGARLEVTASQFANPYLFTGRQWDAELGYYYFRNRYLDPAHGRFVSRDPLGLWGDPLNLGNGYTYAASNPWSLVDPFGLCGGNIEGDYVTGAKKYGKGLLNGLLGFLDEIYRHRDPISGAVAEAETLIGLVDSSVTFWQDPLEATSQGIDAAKGYIANFDAENAGEATTIIAAVLLTKKLGFKGGPPRFKGSLGNWWREIAGEWKGWSKGFADTGKYSWGRMRNIHAKSMDAKPHENLHHRIIAQGGTRKQPGKLSIGGFFGEQYGRYVPNFIKNTRWNVTNYGQKLRNGGSGLHEALHGRNPYMRLNLVQRLWYGSNVWDKAAVVGGGIGAGVVIAELLDL